ncbi:hypothetical protein [Aulosira sp. FACHB-615]|uniref:hypothetical protein n=1 Tax=Aulosira sp. FACHB-615 TaxID=2692777 RepID=UPI00168819E9|nr:hypothetical protein [Aulosira sp. FACHB-615]MBD2492478.1 hypothetical protein [Aulosira sp. FACHB-615]
MVTERSRSMEFWRLDTIDGDFLLVKSPSWAIAPTIRAYHLELINRTRHIQDSHLVEADEVFYSGLTPYYQHLGDRLGFDPSILTPASRHSFFIAAESRGEFWISGLELLMGFDYEAEGLRGKGAGGLRVTSGDFNLDVLAEMLLIPRPSDLEYLLNNLSPGAIALLAKQIGDRLRGKEALDELQKARDLEIFEQQKGVDLLKKSGFKI